MKSVVFISLLIIVCPFWVKAQADTLYALGQIKISQSVKEGTEQYLMFFQNKKKAKAAGAYIVSKTTRFKKVNGIEAIEIEQKSYSSDTSGYYYTYSLMRRDDFSPIHHRTVRQRSTIEAYDFYTDRIVGSDSVVNNSRKGFELKVNRPLLNWEVDLETFRLLPFGKNKSFFINFYHPGSRTEPKLYEYKVVGEETLNSLHGIRIPCWKLKIQYTETNFATFYISKKSQEVIKLEEDFGSGVRYKVKLPTTIRVL